MTELQGNTCCSRHHLMLLIEFRSMFI